jgi:hypothetical protein
LSCNQAIVFLNFSHHSSIVFQIVAVFSTHCLITFQDLSNTCFQACSIIGAVFLATCQTICHHFIGVYHSSNKLALSTNLFASGLVCLKASILSLAFCIAGASVCIHQATASSTLSGDIVFNICSQAVKAVSQAVHNQANHQATLPLIIHSSCIISLDFLNLSCVLSHNHLKASGVDFISSKAQAKYHCSCLIQVSTESL